MATALSSIANGVGQILGRTMMIQLNTSNGIPVPLAILDVVKDEVVTYDAEVSDHPVESGPEISDHIQLKNPTIRLKGIMSSTPLDLSVALANIAAGTIAAITSSQARANLLNSGISEGVGIAGSALQGSAGNLAANAFSGAVDAVSRTILINAFQAKTPFMLVTRRMSYKNVVIQRLSFPRNEETGYALAFEMDIKQLRIVSPLKVQKTQLAENVINGGASSTNIGSQSTQLVSPQTIQAVQSSPLGSLQEAFAKSPNFFGGGA
jgi:hypothetical protein